MTRALAIRGLSLYLPLVLAVAAWVWRRPGRRQAGAALLSTFWNLAFLFPVHLAAERFGWWSFAAEGGLFWGLPVDFYLGWAVLWGALPSLAAPRAPLALIAFSAAALDLLLMPLCAPVLRLGSSWWLGEAAALAVCLVPAQCLSRWTRRDENLRGRVVLQLVLFGALLFVVVPAMVLQATDGDLGKTLDGLDPNNGILVQVLALPLILGLSAVQEFLERGEGTPFPYDPPRRLVTTGVYAYLANPMQVSTTLLFIGLGAVLGEFWLAAAALVGAAYSAGLAQWHEREHLEGRFGEVWGRYRQQVRRWFPRFYPYRESAARLYVAEGCDPCSQIGSWLGRHGPRQLVICAAEDHPTRDLRRLTYEDGDWVEEGVAAMARALEHIHLGWAAVGWTLRLPAVLPLAQLVMDVSGAGPRTVPRRAPSGASCSGPSERPPAEGADASREGGFSRCGS